MLLQFKALVVILVLAAIVFALAKPIALQFMTPQDFAQRRAIWFLLTVTAFVTPSFWLYVLIAVPLLLWAAHKDSNPIALFLLLVFVIPPMEIEIPIVGINRLFDLNNWRLLGLVLLLPAVLTWIRRREQGESLGFSLLDALLLLYGVLQLVLLIPYESWTNTMRRGFLFVLDAYLVFFAFSRLLQNRQAYTDALATLCLMGAIYAPIAVFESLRGWLLYTEVGNTWGFVNRHAWLFRGDDLRAQASAGHSLTLGFIMAMAIGCWLYLKPRISSRATNVTVLTLLSAGLLFSYSRGPWLAAVLLVAMFLMLASISAAGLLKSALLFIGLAVAFATTPFGSEVIDTLPFIGSRGQETVAYRQQLAATSWALIQQNPFLGNPFVMLEMEELRQGQGIIDLVNAYAQVALFYGLIGFSLFAGVLLISLWRGYATFRFARAAGDWQSTRLGAVLIACAVANLFFIATAGHTWPEWVLAGMLASFARLPVARVAPQPEESPAAYAFARTPRPRPSFE